MSTNIVIGLDFSMSSPGICVNYGDVYTLHYLTQKKKLEGYIAPNVTGYPYPVDYSCNEERFHNIAKWVLSVVGICHPDNTIINIEGYAFAASGIIAQIAEATSVTKQILYHNGYKFNLIAPTSVKKSFTGSGRADKELMYKHFVEKTGFKLNDLFKTKSEKIGSPVSDMVDAYALSCYSVESTVNEPVVIV